MKISNSVPACKKLNGWIELKGLSIGATAEHFGVSRQAVYRWLSGKPPRLSVMASIKEETGIPVGDWVER